MPFMPLLPPHPNLPPQGEKEHNLSPAHDVQASSEPGEELSQHVQKLLRLLIGWGMAAVLDAFQGSVGQGLLEQLPAFERDDGVLSAPHKQGGGGHSAQVMG